MDNESVETLRHLRAQARRLGIAIRKERSSPPAGPLYRLLDRESGDVIRRHVPLVDVSTELFWIVRERRRALAQPRAEVHVQLCPSCQTPRLASFRYCRTCGLDYEPVRPPHLDTRSDVLWLQEPPATQWPPGFTQDLAAPSPNQTSLPAPDPFPVETATQQASSRRYRFATPSEVAVGVFVGGLIGLIATIVGARS